ncbi:hypothetical protein D3C73_1591710 [compost metagenome]
MLCFQPAVDADPVRVDISDIINGITDTLGNKFVEIRKAAFDLFAVAKNQHVRA